MPNIALSNSGLTLLAFLQYHHRISYGGVPASEYMLKLMQMKYPTFPLKMTTTQSDVRKLIRPGPEVLVENMPKNYQITNEPTFLPVDLNNQLYICGTRLSGGTGVLRGS